MGIGNLGNFSRTLESELVKRKVVAHSKSANSDTSIEIGQLMDIKTIDHETFSYLWMAIEAKLNLLIVGKEHTGKKQLMFALSHFIPRNEKVLIYGDGTRAVHHNDNFISFVSGSADTESALSNSADRILMSASGPEHLRVLFDCANHGIPFIATLDFASNGKGLLEKLESKQVHVPRHNVNMLDLCILMDHGENSIWKLQNIIEYSWLSRAEYFLDDAKNTPDFQFRITTTVQNGLLNKETLNESKVFRAFGTYNIMSRKEVMEEFEIRVRGGKRSPGA